MLADFHTHTTYSDGTLSVEEAVEAAERRGYDILAITDHARVDNHTEMAATVRSHVDRLVHQTRVRLLAGVELSDFPPELMDMAARDVRLAGAQIVLVHGECIVSDVAPGTNAAAARSRYVDILAHPGHLTLADAAAAVQHGVHLELSARNGHCYANGLVYRVATAAGAKLVVDSDAHAEVDLLSRRKVEAIVVGAGASESILGTISGVTVQQLAQRASQPALSIA